MQPRAAMGRVVLVAILFAAVAGPRLAAPGPMRAAECDLQVIPAGGSASDGPVTVRAYEAFTVVGSGFPPSTELEIEVNTSQILHEVGKIWRPTTDAEGSFVQTGVFIWNDGDDQGFVAPYDGWPCSDHVWLSITPGHPFTDVFGEGGYFHWRWEREIAWLWQSGITSGCAPTRYCPDDSVTRAQMASFLARALDLPAASHDHFTDDDASSHEADIDRLAEARITVGCGGTRFCPEGTVTREQMASFLARGLELPAATRDHFIDDETSKHEADIDRMAEAGITVGCGSTRFCPKGVVTREQMAAFLFRALYPSGG